MGETRWEVFLRVFNKPALLLHMGLLWHSTGFLSLVHAHGTRLSLVAVALATEQYNCTEYCVLSLAPGGM